MSDKTSNYRTKLQKAENNKKSQIKILKKTHESQLTMKGELIHNLEELIEEQESKIAELESHIKGSSTSQTVHVSNTKPSSIRKLVDSINDLHSEKSRIHETWLSTQSELETMKQEHSERVDHLSDNISELERELRKSQAEIIKLQNNEPIICNVSAFSCDKNMARCVAHVIFSISVSLKRTANNQAQECICWKYWLFCLH